MNPAPTIPTAASRSRNGVRTHRWVRQIHLWIGAWGALAAIAYGFTGLVMNHRFGDNPWPQGESIETAKLELMPWPLRKLRRTFNPEPFGATSSTSTSFGGTMPV